MLLCPLLTSDLLDVHYDQDNAWLYLDWKGSQEFGMVQAACRQVLALIQQTGVRKVLNDSTHITQTTRELASWVANEYLPQVSHAGVVYVAWVYSQVLYSRSNINLVAHLSDPEDPQIVFFDDVASAYTWLSSVHAPAESKP